MSIQRSIVAGALALALAPLAAAGPQRHDRDHDHHDRGHEHGQRPVTVKIIGFNDYHGNLQSPGTFGQNTAVPTAQRPAVGGADYLGAYVARLKAQSRHHVVVGAGDFIGASPLISALFFDEPAVETLNRIGVEFNAVGNHEFDKGAAELLRLQHGGCKTSNGVVDPNSCKGAMVGTPVPFEGAKFKWLSANVYATATGRPLLPPYGIKSFAGVRVAFIGMTLKATPTIVTPTGVAGLEFRDEAETVNALVPRLRAKASTRSSCWCTRAASRLPDCPTSTAATATSPIGVADIAIVSGSTTPSISSSAATRMPPTTARPTRST